MGPGDTAGARSAVVHITGMIAAFGPEGLAGLSSVVG